jgi:hypothetical protein
MRPDHVLDVELDDRQAQHRHWAGRGLLLRHHVSVTRGLALVDDRTYIHTMQAINATVRNWQLVLSFSARWARRVRLAARASRWRLPADLAGRRRRCDSGFPDS